MKRFLGSTLVLALLSISALAASNSQTVILGHAVKVGATELPAGDYKVSWTGTGNSVQVTIAKRHGAGEVGGEIGGAEARPYRSHHERSGRIKRPGDNRTESRESDCAGFRNQRTISVKNGLARGQEL